MRNPAKQKYKYQVGGTLRINRSVFYVKRQADNILFDSIKAGEFCYILNSRQMGKSSLALNTIKRLRAEDSGFACVIIDINVLGSEQVSQEQWYLGFADYLIEELELDEKINLNKWWQQENLSPVQKLDKLIRKVILTKIKEPIAIFIDEIDKILDLNFKCDDFFGLIRSFYNEKAKNPVFNHLSFVLLGVARPEELIKEYQITPFNIGRAIDLSGFSVEQSLPLAAGLTEVVDNPQQIIKEIIFWTGGQPFLTQKVCQLILNHPQENKAESDRDFVHRIVKEYIIDNWEANDDPVHLKTIKGRLLHNKHTSRLLGLYQQILEDGSIAANDLVEQIELRLSGLVVRDGDCLKPYNRIYKSVFDLDWVNSILDMERPYAEYIHAWKKSKYDNKWLLREEKFDEALSWSRGKSLSDFDYQYLNASRDLKLQETSAQMALKIERYILRGFVAVLLVICVVLVGIRNYRYCPKAQRTDAGCFDFDISSGDENIFNYSLSSRISKGIEVFKNDKFERAKKYFEKAVELRPNDPVPRIYANNAAAKNRGETYKLAVVVPFNTSEDYSRMILKGVADAQDKFNNKDKKGRLLEILIANDDSDKKLAENVAEKLVSEKKILGVIGHSTSNASKVAQKIYQKGKMAMISPAATSTELTTEDNRVFFRTVPSDEEAGKKLAEHAIFKKIDSIIVLYDHQDSSSKSLKEAFVEKYQEYNGKFSDGDIKKLDDLNFTSTDDLNRDKIDEFFKESKSYEAAVILASARTRPLAIDFIQKNASLPSTSKSRIEKILGNDAMYSYSFLQEAGSSAEEMIVAVTWSRKTCYAKEAEQRWQGGVNWRTAASYDATQAFIQAIKDTPKKSPERKDILEQLRKYNSKKNSITNTSEDIIWFGSKGNSSKESRLVEVVKDDKIPTASGLELGFKEFEVNEDIKCPD